MRFNQPLSFSLVLVLAAAIGSAEAAPQTRQATQYDRIVRGSTLIGMSVMDEQRNPLGYVEEVIIDHKNGYLALFGVRRSDNPDGPLMLVPPVRAEFHPDKGWIRLVQPLAMYATRVEARVDQITAQQMTSIYSLSEAKPFWSQPYGLVTLDDLDGRIVRGTGWKKIGRIHDVALAPGENWKLAYVVLSELPAGDDQFIAVPVKALRRAKRSPTWLIQATPESLKRLPRFRDDWPRMAKPLSGFAGLQKQQE